MKFKGTILIIALKVDESYEKGGSFYWWIKRMTPFSEWDFLSDN